MRVYNSVDEMRMARLSSPSARTFWKMSSPVLRSVNKTYLAALQRIGRLPTHSKLATTYMGGGAQAVRNSLIAI